MLQDAKRGLIFYEHVIHHETEKFLVHGPQSGELMNDCVYEFGAFVLFIGIIIFIACLLPHILAQASLLELLHLELSLLLLSSFLLDVFKGFASLLLDLNAKLADHVDVFQATKHNSFLLVKDVRLKCHLKVAKFLKLRQQALDASQRQLGVNGLDLESSKCTQQMIKTTKVDKFAFPLVDIFHRVKLYQLGLLHLFFCLLIFIWFLLACDAALEPFDDFQ